MQRLPYIAQRVHHRGGQGCSTRRTIPSGRSFTLRDGRRVKVEATGGDEWAWRRFLYEPGGRAALDERSAICDDERLFLIVGRMIVCMDLPTGFLTWTREGDDSACFGLYRAPEADALIMHGEQQIARVSAAGGIEWRCWGRDIFTGPIQLERDAIYATDFNGDVYRIDYRTGDSAIVGHSEPFPH